MEMFVQPLTAETGLACSVVGFDDGSIQRGMRTSQTVADGGESCTSGWVATMHASWDIANKGQSRLVGANAAGVDNRGLFLRAINLVASGSHRQAPPSWHASCTVSHALTATVTAGSDARTGVRRLPP